MSTRVCAETGLRLGEPMPALERPHFPARFQAVIWRNWGLVTAERLAGVLHATPSRIAREARALGLGAEATPDMEHTWLQRGYITLIRQNWHVLPYPQLLRLIDRTPEQLAYALREDDFLWNKLGRAKPDAPPVTCTPLTPWFGETPYSKGYATRIENLNALVAKAARHGIGVYLTLNEPRAMPPAFYERFPDWKGPYYEQTDVHAMCTTDTEGLVRLKEALQRVPEARAAAREDLRNVAEAAYCHFRTTYLQIRFNWI